MRGHETGGNTLALDLVRSLGPGMLLLGDRGFGGSYVLFGAMAATGADLLWRVKSSAQLPVLERFSDGSYRSELVIKDDKGRKQQVLSVRVVVYEICELYRSARAARRSVPSGIGTTAHAIGHTLCTAVAEIARELLPERPLRATPRVVQRNMSKFGVKRTAHRNWPRPTKPTREAVRALAAAPLNDNDPSRGFPPANQVGRA
ncbi:MAG: hypothetical protein M0Z82_02335 [Actinomycetota bacterium]|nr:hypothetical protein [Actinomycetota bacterium]